jgi:hypothetical protein
VSAEARFGLDISGRPETARTMRLVIGKYCYHLGGIWAPLLPNLREIEFETEDIDIEPRTFAGLTFTKVKVPGWGAKSHEMLRHCCLAFDNAP